MNEPWDRIEGVVTIWRDGNRYRWIFGDDGMRLEWGGMWTSLARDLLEMGDKCPDILMDVHRILLRLIDGRLIRERA